MKSLIIEDILLINRKTVERHGGNFVPPNNLLKDGGLKYLVEAVDGELYGQPMYSPIIDKAAVLYVSDCNGPYIPRWKQKNRTGGCFVVFKVER